MYAVRIEALGAGADPGLAATARDLLREYGDFVLSATGPERFAAARLTSEIAEPAARYAAPGSELLLAFVGERAAGCAAFRPLEGSVPELACELKRLWVRPAFRRGAIGEGLAHAVFERAAAAGYRAIYLDTEPESMPAAVRLYRRLGFEQCPAYNDQVVEGLSFFRRTLPGLPDQPAPSTG
ncbi:MAG TPA: GNAT family N-acetyltransferase [Acidisarcina sp.]